MKHTGAAISFNAHKNQPSIFWPGTKPHLSHAWELWYRQWIRTAMVTMSRCTKLFFQTCLGCAETAAWLEMNPASANAWPGALYWIPSHPQPGEAPTLGVRAGGAPGALSPDYFWHISVFRDFSLIWTFWWSFAPSPSALPDLAWL